MELTRDEKIGIVTRARDAFYRGQLTLAKKLPKDLQQAWVDDTFSNLTECYPGFKNRFYQTVTDNDYAIRHGMLDPNILAHCCPLDHGHHDETEVTSSPGDLTNLPIEIMSTILVDFVDLKTLTQLRSVNRKFRLTIDELPEYATIIKHAPSSLRGALSLEVAFAYTCKNLYTQLCSLKCHVCGNFGGFLYLLTCKRVCYDCFTDSPQTRVMATAGVKLMWALTLAKLKAHNVPIIRSIPGRYGGNDRQKLERGRLALVDSESAGIAAILEHVSAKAYTVARDSHLKQRNDRLLARKQKWQDNGADPAKKPKSGLGDIIVDHREFGPKRFMCNIPFPALSRANGQVEWGVLCQGCVLYTHLSPDSEVEVMKNALARRKVLYSHKGFLEHFLGCTDAQLVFKMEYEDRITSEDPTTPGILQEHGISGTLPAYEGFDTSQVKHHCKQHAGLEGLSAEERGKKLWDILKPKSRPRRRKVASGEDSVHFGEASVQAGEALVPVGAQALHGALGGDLAQSDYGALQSGGVSAQSGGVSQYVPVPTQVPQDTAGVGLAHSGNTTIQPDDFWIELISPIARRLGVTVPDST